MVDERDLKIKLVKQMLRKEYIGRRYGQAQHIISKVPQHERKAARNILKAMVADPSSPVAHYKDKMSAYRLASKPKAERFIESLGGDPELDDEYEDLRIIRR